MPFIDRRRGRYRQIGVAGQTQLDQTRLDRSVRSTHFDCALSITQNRVP